MVQYPENLQMTGFSELLSGLCCDFFKITFFAMNGIHLWILKMFLIWSSIIAAGLSKNIFKCRLSVFWSYTVLRNSPEGPKVTSGVKFLTFYSVQLLHPFWGNGKASQRVCQRLLFWVCIFTRSPCNPFVNTFLKTTRAPCCHTILLYAPIVIHMDSVSGIKSYK